VAAVLLPSLKLKRGPSIDPLIVTVVAPTFLLGHMYGLSVFPMMNDALVESVLAAVLLLAGEAVLL
jgi:hypothetical protein